MRLKNKKTGEIVETDYMFGVSVPTTETFGCKSYDQIAAYSSLAELNEEWEDVPEESKGWCITMYGGISRIAKDDEDLIPDLKEIGNYFNDKESAYEALDRLKAWKRLRDKGFRFSGWKIDQKKHLGVITIKTEPYYSFEFDDLDLLFSGGEE